MGVATRLLGYIEEAWPGLAGGGDPVRMEKLLEVDRLIGRHNESVLEALAAEDSWPPLCRAMFAWAPSDLPMITYKRRLIVVAASLKNLEGATRNWLDKFEALLRQLYWESAYIRCEFGLYGPHEFRWRPPDSWIDELCQARLSPIQEIGCAAAGERHYSIQCHEVSR
jgi:hypothetical protein